MCPRVYDPPTMSKACPPPSANLRRRRSGALEGGLPLAVGPGVNRLAEGLEERTRDGIVGRVPLRMPLDREGEARRAADIDRFGRSVGRLAIHDDAGTWDLDPLAVERVG